MSINSSALDVFRVLRLVGISNGLLRAADISKRLGITLSITRRAVTTLVQTGYLQRHRHWGRYEIGFATQQLANSLLNRFPVRHAALPCLRQLAFHFHGTASLNVRLGWYSVRLGSIEGGGNLFIHARRLGDPTLLGMTGAAQTMLAFLDDDEINGYWRFVAKNAKEQQTKAIRKRVQDQIESIRKSGLCVEKDQPRVNTTTVSVPIRNYMGRIIASISIEGPAENLPDRDRGSMVDALMKMVKSFEKQGQSSPKLFAGPFDYLNPDEIRFGLDFLQEA